MPANDVLEAERQDATLHLKKASSVRFWGNGITEKSENIRESAARDRPPRGYVRTVSRHLEPLGGTRSREAERASDVIEGETTEMLEWIQRFHCGDQTALNELVIHFQNRLVALTRKMLGTFPDIRRCEQTDDVFHGALIRLHRALRKVTPRSTRELFGLATLQIRRELLSLARKRRKGLGTFVLDGAIDADGGPPEAVDPAETPAALEEWTAFHDAAASLPGKQREVFDLLWYHGLTQQQAAEVLDLSVRMIKYHWRHARLMIYHALDGELPAAACAG